MCGIVGGNLFDNEEQVIQALDLISYRGTDARGTFNHQGMWLGHNRLSIQDLSETANQPMVDNSGDLVITYNGELWASMSKYRTQLESEYNFQTKNSDTELILKMYHKYGTEVFNILDGMYSFAIFDKRNSSVIFGRDFMGRLPLYFYKRGTKIMFASELKCITELLDINASDIILVPPGVYYTYNLQTGDLVPYNFYTHSDKWEVQDLDTLVRNLRSLMEDGVENELISDVPVCTILSGGIDSTIITYLLSKKYPNLEAFTISVGDEKKKKDDLYYARMAAKWLGIPLNEVIVDREYIENNLNDATYAIEMRDWRQVTCAVAQLPLAKAIHDKGFKVTFGGEGSDELFASYGHIVAWHYKDDDYVKARYKLINHLGKEDNLIRTNKIMMYGGTVEVRTPFLHKPMVEYCLKIPPKFKHIDKVWKPLIRKAFENEIPEELLYRPKVTMQVGCHTDYLKSGDLIEKSYDRYFNKHNMINRFL
tara:strand:- start:30 stop:1472 length:1443 start_codon:yes stop_codon:yes gene_type:complete